jgi:hypothetical protein
MQRSRDGRIYQTFSGQRLGKHVSVAMEQILNNATFGLQQGKSLVFCVVRAEIINKTRFGA